MNRTQAILDGLIAVSDSVAAYRRELAHMANANAACDMLARAERLIDDAIEAIPYAEGES